MKKLMILFCVIAGGAMAQTPVRNGDFEEWTHPKPFVFIPKYWTSPDSVINGGVNNIYTVSQSTDAYSGAMAMRLSALQSANANVRNTAGICLGRADIDTATFQLDYYRAGDDIAYRPHVLKGYYKFVPDAGTQDSAYIKVYVRNGAALDPWAEGMVAEGAFTFTPTAVYLPFSVPLQVVNDTPADSLVVGIFYSSKNTGTTPTGYLLVDKLGTESMMSVQNDAVTPNINIYPNPSFGYLRIENKGGHNMLGYTIHDAAGKCVAAQKTPPAEISIGTLKPGIYTLTLQTVGGNVTHKFVKR